MAMKNPPHVGGVIRRQVIEPLGLTVTEAAKALGVGRQALSSLLNEKAALTSDMALRIEKAFGPKMDHLMRMQLAYDLAQARKEERAMRVKRYGVKKGTEHPGLSRCPVKLLGGERRSHPFDTALRAYSGQAVDLQEA